MRWSNDVPLTIPPALHDKMAKLGGDMIVKRCAAWAWDALPATPQPGKA